MKISLAEAKLWKLTFLPLFSFLKANKMGFFIISPIKPLTLDIISKSMAILLKICKYISTLSLIEFHISRDDFTNNSAISTEDGSGLTPHICKNLFAFSTKSTQIKKSFKLKKIYIHINKYIYTL